MLELQKISEELYEVALKSDQMFYCLEAEDDSATVKISFDFNDEKSCYALIISIPNSGKIIEDSYLIYTQDELLLAKDDFIMRLQEILQAICEQEAYSNFAAAIEEHNRITQVKNT